MPSPHSPPYGWGGARLRADRTSDCLTLSQATSIIVAARRAIEVGMPLNRHITIHWEKAGIDDARAAWATGRFLKLATDFTAKRGGRFAWIYVRENGDGKGSHVHILAHVPAGASLGPLQRRWLRLVASAPYRPETIHTARIGATANAWRTSPAYYAVNLDAVVAYLLKGADARARADLDLPRGDDGGRVIGKRCGRSQNLKMPPIASA